MTPVMEGKGREAGLKLSSKRLFAFLLLLHFWPRVLLVAVLLSIALFFFTIRYIGVSSMSSNCLFITHMDSLQEEDCTSI